MQEEGRKQDKKEKIEDGEEKGLILESYFTPHPHQVCSVLFCQHLLTTVPNQRIKNRNFQVMTHVSEILSRV